MGEKLGELPGDTFYTTSNWDNFSRFCPNIFVTIRGVNPVNAAQREA